jgi:hypothetical protein
MLHVARLQYLSAYLRQKTKVERFANPCERGHTHHISDKLLGSLSEMLQRQIRIADCRALDVVRLQLAKFQWSTNSGGKNFASAFVSIANVFEMVAATSNSSNDVIIRIAGVIEHPANDFILRLRLLVRDTFSLGRHSKDSAPNGWSRSR